MPRPSLEERFWSKVDRTEDCWLWTATTSKGYGQIRVNGKLLPAHRVAWKLLMGEEPPDLLDHRLTCPRRCVRPEHLRPATNKQNQENLSGARCHNRSSGIRGVSWDKQYSKWAVSVGHNGKNHRGGRFHDLAEAESAAINLRNRLFTHNDLDRRAS